MNVQGLNRTRGYDGMQHRLIGVEHTCKNDHNDHMAVCECGWTTDRIRLTNDVESLAEAKRQYEAHSSSCHVQG